MDKKTNVKVINNMAEKIELLETNIKELEQKANRTGQFHLDAINEKINKLEKVTNGMNDENYNSWNNAFNNGKIEALNDRIAQLEKINLLNAERNTKYMEHFEKMADIMEMCEIADKRIDKVSEMADNINERCNVLTNFDEKIINCLEIIDERIHHLKSDIKELAKNDIELESKIVENYDDLEAKNFVVKRDVDTAIYDNEMFLKQLEDKFINNNEGGNNE